MKHSILAAALIAALALSACAPNYSNGSRTGVVTKLSEKGLMFKSWEGSMNQGGTKTSTNSDGQSSTVPNAFEFNVADPALIAKLNAALDSGARVTVTYRQWFLGPPTINSNTVIIGVKEAL